MYFKFEKALTAIIYSLPLPFLFYFHRPALFLCRWDNRQRFCQTKSPRLYWRLLGASMRKVILELWYISRLSIVVGPMGRPSINVPSLLMISSLYRPYCPKFLNHQLGETMPGRSLNSPGEVQNQALFH